MSLKLPLLLVASMVLGMGSGCAPGRSGNLPVTPLATSEGDPSQPLSVSILEEHFDAKRLIVAVEVQPRIEWNPSESLIQLKALNEGAVVGEAFYSLASAPEAIDGSLSPGENVRVTISVDVPAITDYQVNLLWGKDAKGYMERVPKSALVVLHNVRLQREPTLTVLGSLENRGSKPVHVVTVGLGFVWVPRGESADGLVPEEETMVTMNELNLFPGRVQPFSLEISEDIPRSDDGQFEPVMRVVEVAGGMVPSSGESASSAENREVSR